MALWNIGAFMLRTSPEASSAGFAEVIIHIGVLLVPAFWYHFVLIFLDATTRYRPSLALAYAITLVYSLINLSRSPLFMKGVTWTHWGWAPAPRAAFPAIPHHVQLLHDLRAAAPGEGQPRHRLVVPTQPRHAHHPRHGHQPGRRLHRLRPLRRDEVPPGRRAGLSDG